MYVYTFDPITRAYTGGVPADFDQLAPGDTLVPAFAMRKPAPAGSLERAGFWPFANAYGDDWEVRKLEPPPEPRKPTGDEIRAEVQATLARMRVLLEQLEAPAA